MYVFWQLLNDQSTGRRILCSRQVSLIEMSLDIPLPRSLLAIGTSCLSIAAVIAQALPFAQVRGPLVLRFTSLRFACVVPQAHSFVTLSLS